MTAGGGNGRWAEVLALFDEVVELEPAARSARLNSIGAGDAELQRSVERLLAADADADALLAPLDVAIGSPDEAARDEDWDRDPLGLAGKSISHFQVLEPLGHGGMAVVYKAEDQQLGRTIALKFPLANQHLDPRAKQRFLHEARAVAALNHPAVCEIYETGETSDGHLFHAMPLYQGHTLKTRLAREGALPLDEALGIAGQLAEGLGAAHHAGIVHRDLKPANVMLLPHGSVKILDFGLAKVSDFSLTASGTRLGTVFYMAPEQVHGRTLDARTDLWALGVLLYEMVTGSRPFTGGNEIAIAHAIAHEEPVRPSTLRSAVSPDLDDFILTLLRKQPDRRYQSAEAAVAAIAAVQLDRPAARFRTARRSIKWSTVALATAGLAAAGAAAWWGGRMNRAPSLPAAVAVLPFHVTGDTVDGGYLAAGLSDGIMRELGLLRGVVVPSYATAARYRGSTKPLVQIAGELGVSSLLTGNVRAVGDQVRVDAQLLDATGKQQLWAQRYDRPRDEILGIQREATRGMLTALRVRVSDAERLLLNQPATSRARAYELYLRGRSVELAGLSHELWISLPADNIRRAQSLYTQARDLDPGFALARARLAQSHIHSATTYDPSDARSDQARLEAEAALRLQPGLPEAHEVLGHYWAHRGEVDRSIGEFRQSLTGRPNNTELRLSLGRVYALAGRLDEAVAEFDRAMQLEPGSPKAAFAAAVFHLRLRRDEEAMRAFDRAIRLAPDYHMARVIKGHTYLRWKGTPDTLAAAMRIIPEEWDPDGMATWARYTALWVQRRYDEALAMLDRSRARLSRDGLVYQPAPLMRARLQEALGRRAEARVSYTRARALLRDSVNAHPEDASIRVALGLAHAGLGERAAAAREARKAMELVPVGENTPAATAFMGGAAEVLAKAGDIDGALKLLELLFSMPAGREVTIAFLRVWPGFDPLRGDPRFAELVERYASN